MSTSAVTKDEIQALVRAVRSNCECPPGRLRQQVHPCPVCLLLWDQSSALRLVFYRRHAEALRRGELLQTPGWRG